MATYILEWAKQGKYIVCRISNRGIGLVDENGNGLFGFDA